MACYYATVLKIKLHLCIDLYKAFSIQAIYNIIFCQRVFSFDCRRSILSFIIFMHANIHFKSRYKACIFVRHELKARSKQLYGTHEEMYITKTMRSFSWLKKPYFKTSL